MKNFYKVSNIIENGPIMDRKRTVVGPMKDRVKSRISPINHRLWTVIAPMLLVVFGLFGVNVEMWAGNVTLKATAESSPSTGGYVYVAKSNSGPSSYSLTSDHADETKYSVGTSWTGYATVSQDFYLFASPKTTDYSFKGWSKTSSDVSGDTSNPKKVTVSGKNSGTVTDGPYYAIFAKYKPSTTEIDFGDVAYNSGTYPKTVTIDCHNVGTWSNPSGLSGMLSASLSNNKDDNTQHTCTVTVTLNTTTAGTYNQTLEVTTSRGGTINVTVKAKVTATPSYKWSSALDNLYVGQTVNNVITFSSSGAKTYSIENWTPTGSNNEGATKPTFSGNTLVCSQAGTLTLKVVQAAETNGFDAGGSTIDITINKNVPTVTWSTQFYYFNKNYINVYTITAGDASLFSIESSDLDVATVNGTNLTTYYKPTSTTLTLTAVENYKWAGKVFTKSITPKDVPNHVPFTITSSNHSGFEGPKSNDVSWESNGYMLGDNGWTTQDDNFVIKFNGVPDKLTFDRHLDKWGLNLPETYLCQVFESADGSTWPTDPVKEINVQTQDVASGDVQLHPTTRYLKFTYHGTVYCHFNNIKVTELNDFYPDPASINFGTNNKIGIARADETFNFHYANVGYKVNLSTNDSHFTVSPTSITTIGGEKAGYVAITVGYSTEEVHTSNNAKVTITDELGHSTTVDLIGATERKTQTIHWTEGYTTDEPSVVIGKTYIGVAEASTGYTIKYESSDEDVIEILDGGTSFRPGYAGGRKQPGQPCSGSGRWNLPQPRRRHNRR